MANRRRASEREDASAKNDRPTKRARNEEGEEEEEEEQEAEVPIKTEKKRREVEKRRREKGKEKQVAAESPDEEEDEAAQITQPPSQESEEEEAEEEASEAAEVEEEGEEAEEEEEEEEHAQHPQEAGEVGIIEKIRLENFMCHRHLELSLGPNINFVVGVNGSGKSAILVALTICLGSKASFTNRGSKLTEFIRGNASYASIAVTLRNRGPEAYRPKEYGPSLTIERRISSNGSSTYKVKDHTGKRTLAHTRAEVSMILEQFNVQVDNPCAILMQDTSRQFLNSSRPSAKYQFFLKATQLEQMQSDYQDIAEHLKRMDAILSRKLTIVPEMQKRVKELERMYRDMHQLRTMESEVVKMKHALAWSYVKEKEDEVKDVEQQLAQYKERLNKFDEKMEQIKTRLEEQGAINDEKTKEVNESGNAIKAVTEAKKAIEARMHELTREANRCKTQISDCKKRLSHVGQRKERLVNYIEEAKAKAARDTSAEREERLQEIKEKQVLIDSLTEKHLFAKKEMEELDQKAQSLVTELREFDRTETEEKRELLQLQNRLKDFQMQKQDRTRCFGRQMPQLLHAINMEPGWRQKPIGPIGLCMSVKENKWANAIEATIGKLVSSFIVDNHQDAQLLRQLARQLNVQVELVVQNFRNEIYHIPNNRRPPEGLRTVLSQIEADHPMVYNVLIDQRTIEGVLLFERMEDAREVIYRQRAPNVKEGYLPDASRFFVRGTSENFTSGQNHPTKLGVNFDDMIRDTTQQIKEQEQKIASLNPQREELMRAKAEASHALKRMRDELQKQQRQLNLLSAEKAELENFKEDEPEDLSELEGNLRNLDKEQEEITNQMTEFEKAAKIAAEQLLPLTNELKAKKHEGLQLAQESEKMSSDLLAIHNRIRKLSTQQSQLEKVKVDVVKNITQLEERLQQLQAELSTCEEKAREIAGERVEVDKTSQELQRAISVMETRIQNEQKGQMSTAELTKKYTKAKKKLEDTQRDMRKLHHLKERLQNNLNERLQRWIRFRKSIARRTSIYFNSFLTRKNYAGSISFDHDKGTLDIKVQLDNATSSQQQEIRDTKSLSGGERSFSTVALLLALWEAMESPFRAMDEFDVFMDAVNRRMSIKLLMEAAREHQHHQFIFITPHDLSSVISGPDVRVHKMQDPERRDRANLEQSLLQF